MFDNHCEIKQSNLPKTQNYCSNRIEVWKRWERKWLHTWKLPNNIIVNTIPCSKHTLWHFAGFSWRRLVCFIFIRWMLLRRWVLIVIGRQHPVLFHILISDKLKNRLFIKPTNIFCVNKWILAYIAAWVNNDRL